MADRVLSGRYRIVRHIARGGMAEVYLAHDQLLDRPVAVKVLFPELADDASFVERFRREARAAAGLNHHNIVSVYDFGEDSGSYFIVMEYVEGETLRDIIGTKGPMAPSHATEIAADVAAALDAAHRQGIIHRDVKPGNVLVSGVVKVADFGIARAGDPRDSLTQTGAVMGTATYLSPEQAQGKDLDPRTDIYSLGVVLYEMLTGRPPFTGPSPVAIAYKHASEVPVPPSEHNADVPPGLDAVVLKAMAKDPAQRHSSADDLRAELLAMGRGRGEAAPTLMAPAAAGAEETLTLASAEAPPAAAAPLAEPTMVGAGPSRAAAFRRRQLTAIGLLVLLVLVAFGLIALLRSGESGTTGVPSVVGDLVADAERKVTDAGLRPVVNRERIPFGDPTRVAEQEPFPTSNVRKGTTVTLYVPAGAATTTPTTRAPTTTRAPATTAPPTTVAPTTTPPTTGPITVPPVTAPTTIP